MMSLLRAGCAKKLQPTSQVPTSTFRTTPGMLPLGVHERFQSVHDGEAAEAPVERGTDKKEMME